MPDAADEERAGGSGSRDPELGWNFGTAGWSVEYAPGVSGAADAEKDRVSATAGGREGEVPLLGYSGDDPEAIALALWNEGRKQEALEFLQGRIARERSGQASPGTAAAVSLPGRALVPAGAASRAGASEGPGPTEGSGKLIHLAPEPRIGKEGRFPDIGRPPARWPGMALARPGWIAAALLIGFTGVGAAYWSGGGAGGPAPTDNAELALNAAPVAEERNAEPADTPAPAAAAAGPTPAEPATSAERASLDGARQDGAGTASPPAPPSPPAEEAEAAALFEAEPPAEDLPPDEMPADEMPAEEGSAAADVAVVDDAPPAEDIPPAGESAAAEAAVAADVAEGGSAPAAPLADRLAETAAPVAEPAEPVVAMARLPNPRPQIAMAPRREQARAPRREQARPVARDDNRGDWDDDDEDDDDADWSDDDDEEYAEEGEDLDLLPSLAERRAAARRYAAARRAYRRVDPRYGGPVIMGAVPRGHRPVVIYRDAPVFTIEGPVMLRTARGY